MVGTYWDNAGGCLRGSWVSGNLKGTAQYDQPHYHFEGQFLKGLPAGEEAAADGPVGTAWALPAWKLLPTTLCDRGWPSGCYHSSHTQHLFVHCKLCTPRP